MQPQSSSYLAIVVLLATCAFSCGQLPLAPPVQPLPPAAQKPAQDGEQLDGAEQPAAAEAKPEPKGPAPTPAQLKELIAQLESDDFRTRDSAQLRLTGIGKTHPETTLDTILELYLNGTQPESRYRLRDVLFAAKRAEFESRPRGFVGIVMMPSLIRNADGTTVQTIQVGRIVEGSAAERDGLLLGDHIVNIDDLTFDDGNPSNRFDTTATNKFADYVTGKRAGDKVVLTVVRNAQRKKIPLTLGQRPPELLDYRVRQRFEDDFKRWLEENSARLRGEK